MTDAISPFSNSNQPGPILPEAFDQFVGDTFFRQMLKSLRSTTGKPAFMHGGQAEEIFQSQLDELLISEMVDATRDSFSADLFEQQFLKSVPTDAQSAFNNSQNQSTPAEAPTDPQITPTTNSNFDKDA